jgi:hypothetical protein
MQSWCGKKEKRRLEGRFGIDLFLHGDGDRRSSFLGYDSLPVLLLCLVLSFPPWHLWILTDWEFAQNVLLHSCILIYLFYSYHRRSADNTEVS